MKYVMASIIALILLACKNSKQKVVSHDNDFFYTCSMHPQIMQDQPGKCPICGMELIKVEKKKGSNADAIILSDQQVQLGNIQVDTIAKGTIGNETVLT